MRLEKEAAKHEGAHVLATADQSCLPNCTALRERFRFRRAGAHFVAYLARGDDAAFVELLAAVLAEEDEWSKHVRPNLSSPLLLPKGAFAAKRDVRALWEYAESFNDPDKTRKYPKLRDRFVEFHLKEYDDSVSGRATPWLSDDGWGWRDDGARHGTPLDVGDEWKYSFQLPDGFHYDVEPARKGKKAFQDANGKSHLLPKGYLNITAYGLLRGD